MPTREDLLADIRESQDAARELVAYEEACEAGYEGTLEEFRHDMSATRSPAPEPTNPVDSDDDIPF